MLLPRLAGVAEMGWSGFRHGRTFSTSARQRRLEVAIDELAARFGSDVVYRAHLTKKKRSPGPSRGLKPSTGQAAT
jgi:predicted oxidoreductase